MSSKPSEAVSFRKQRLDYLYQVSTVLKIPLPDLLDLPIPVVQDLIQIYEKYHKESDYSEKAEQTS